MAQDPRSPRGARGVVTPPNQAGPAGNRANNSSLPLHARPGPREFCGCDEGDRRRGCFPLGGTDSPLRDTDPTFDVESARMPQPPAPVAPGKGAIPVAPLGPTPRSGQSALPGFLKEI